MAKRSLQAVRQSGDDHYLELVRAFPLRPIRSDAELDRAIAVIDSLVIRKDLDSDQEDYLDVLGDLVHKYEAEHDPLLAVSDSDMIRFLVDSNEMSQAELAEQSGIAESTISEILAGKRKLSRRHIAALSRVFRVSPSVFFPEAEERQNSVNPGRSGC
jgi:HTH-type transcriptional regulator / antitoxin HigA